MKTALILAGILLLWYCVKELRTGKPNWTKAINSAIFWPLPLVFDLFSKKRSKEQSR